jgi:hypothetical protein
MPHATPAEFPGIGSPSLCPGQYISGITTGVDTANPFSKPALGAGWNHCLELPSRWTRVTSDIRVATFIFHAIDLFGSLMPNSGQ